MRLLRSKVFAALLVAMVACSAFADDTYIGPLDLSVGNAKKKVYKKKFNATDQRAALLEIANGVNGRARAKAVIVVLNGKKVCTKKQVGRKTAKAAIPLLLQSKNKIKIVVRSGGSEISVKLSARKADFKRLVGFGDSLLAGFQDGSLVETYQVWGFGAQIAKQGGAKFTLPLISEPGIPPRYRLENGMLVQPDPNPGHRTNPNEDADNLAVPGANVWASLNVKSMGAANPFFDIILGGRRTMVQEVQQRNPTFVILWIGSNDVLGMVTSTDTDDHTKLSDFKRDFESVLKELSETGACIVASNLPDVTAIAVLMKPLSAQVILLGVPADALILITDVLKTSFHPDDYLTPNEVTQIRSTIQQFNAEIAKLCEKYGVPLVDAYALSRRWEDNGVRVDGQALTAEWRGGLFSLDGIHPSNTGHALLANEFIKVINQSYETSIPFVDVSSVFRQDPNKPTGVPADEATVCFESDNPFEPVMRLLSRGRTASNSHRRP